MSAKQRTCIKCGEQTDIKLGADPDLTGIAVCEEHKDEVRSDLLLLLLPGADEFDEEWFTNKYKSDEEE